MTTDDDSNNNSMPAGGGDGDNNNNISPHSPEDSVEKAFGLLQNAKALEAKTEYWKAAELYVQAHQLLQALSDQASREAVAAAAIAKESSSGDDDNKKLLGEQQQIAHLYREKAEEYWSQSRQCLIRAMQEEKKNDEKEKDNALQTSSSNTATTTTTPLTCNRIDDAQAKSRNQTFTVLFSRPVEETEGLIATSAPNVSSNNAKDESSSSTNVIDQQWTIEERLQELNKSLPSGFKTDDERMQDINRGLNKLGLSLYTQKQPFARFQDEMLPPKSEEEQMEEIMAQAQDEVALAKSIGGGGAAATIATVEDNEDDDDLFDDDDEYASEKGDELLEDDQLAIKTIRKKVVKAQIKIAELVALLDEAKLATDREHANADDDSSLEGNGAATFLAPGKKKLKSAQRDLRKAMEEWKDALMVVSTTQQKTTKGERAGATDSTLLIAEREDDTDDEPPDLIALVEEEEIAVVEPPKTSTTAIELSDPDTRSLPPCPVTILSGFLGSGKTTLIQYILKSPDHGKRIAVIENEFGEGLAVESLIARDGIDPQSDSLQDLIELPNGCICCTVKDSLVSALESLLGKRQELDYILIEASGMANPGPIASVFWLDDALDSRLKLDGIVTLVDGAHILEQLNSTEEAAQQIAYADRIVLNKVDLLQTQKDPASMPSKERPSAEEVENQLRKLHPTAPILRTSFSKIPDLDWILNADCFGGADRLEELESVFQNLELERKSASKNDSHDHHQHDHDLHDCEQCQDHDNDHHHLYFQHKHTESITTIALHETGSVDLAKLNAWLAEILWPNQDETDQVLTAMLHNSTNDSNNQKLKGNGSVQQLFRIKGIVSAFYDENWDDSKLDNDDSKYRLGDTGLDRRRFILQAVHDLWEVYPASDDLMFEPEEDRMCKVVVIGKYLQETELRSGFQKCFHTIDTLEP